MNEMRQGGSGKSASAFRTISEVAAEVGVPQHVLRFWETRFFQLRPLKRAGGRRYYRPEDVAFLHRVRRLLYEEGYTIKGVQKLLRAGSKEVETGDTALPESVAAVKANSSGPSMDRGAESVAAVGVPTAKPKVTPAARGLPAGLGAVDRTALKAIRDELLELRDLLRHERP
jgi:DNA-binding transcriptional MerR regulator